jgi:APA family basic amino acid/polyamine antiporter
MDRKVLVTIGLNYTKMKAFLKKDFDSIRENAANSSLAKNLTALDLILIGLGAIVGAGAFVVTGQVAAQYAGPAVMASYAIAGLVCIFVALAYAELAVMLPTSGSVYTYSYVAYGEIFAWIMGSVMFLEMGFGAASVAAGWSSYVQGILLEIGISLPESLRDVPGNGGIVNLPAMGIVLFAGLVVYLGTKDSKKLNTILVVIKFLAITAFVIAAAPHFDQRNWANFMPFGFDGVVTGSSILFFAFNGFGVIATASEECKNPKRDITIGIVGALILSTIIYVIIGGLATGIISFDQLNNAEPLSYALKQSGSHMGSIIVGIGAICGMTTVLMMQIYGISRIFYVIARDGLLPKSLSELHPKHGSPYKALMVIVPLIALICGFLPFDMISKLTSMGGIIDYICVTSIVIYLRVRMPNALRPFQCPGVFIIAPIALLACSYLLLKQIIDINGQLMLTGKLIILWLVSFTALYFVRSKAI